MTEKRFTCAGSGGLQLPGVLWLPEGEPKAVLQITHGMTEHIGRYAPIAEYLTAHGVAVAGFDLRGHGANGEDAKCASFGEGGWQKSLEDMHLFYEYIEGRLPGVPHFMLGFSLGSFLLREYLGIYRDNPAGAVILGTGHQPGAVLGLMLSIVNGQIKKGGFDNTTPLVQKLSFETYNQKFAPCRTASDWLCADEAELDKYIADTLCRESISAGLFWELLAAMKRTGSGKAYKGWDKNIPVLLISGADDPVGDFGKGVAAVEKAMKKAKVKNLAVKLFPGARHDLLHEEASGAAAQARQLLLGWMLGE